MIQSSRIKSHHLFCKECSVWKRIGVNSQFHIPIPILWNLFLEYPNSNSSCGIGATTPIPIQWNWGDSTGIPISNFPHSVALWKGEKDNQRHPVHPFFPTFSPFQRATECGKFWNRNPSGIPQFHWVWIGVEATISLQELELGHSTN